jgi:hypothetical protein
MSFVFILLTEFNKYNIINSSNTPIRKQCLRESVLDRRFHLCSTDDEEKQVKFCKAMGYENLKDYQKGT